MSSYRLTLAYDGTDYFGWQVQPELTTIQGVLADAVRRVCGEVTLPQGSGRTDTGVHAEGQVVSLTLQTPIPAERLHRALNRILPAAVRVMQVRAALPGFHARAGVLHKTYEYRIFQRRIQGQRDERICPPRECRYVWDCRLPLDLERMQIAAAALVGTHDFTSFAASDPERAQRLAAYERTSNVRTIMRSEWFLREGLLVYRVTGSGFLHHMVRTIAGTCAEAGAGNVAPEQMRDILAARDRRLAGPTAPPQGLHLMEVSYSSDAEAHATQDEAELASA